MIDVFPYGSASSERNNIDTNCPSKGIRKTEIDLNPVGKKRVGSMNHLLNIIVGSKFMRNTWNVDFHLGSDCGGIQTLKACGVSVSFFLSSFYFIVHTYIIDDCCPQVTINDQGVCVCASSMMSTLCVSLINGE